MLSLLTWMEMSPACTALSLSVLVCPPGGHTGTHRDGIMSGVSRERFLCELYSASCGCKHTERSQLVATAGLSRPLLTEKIR